MGELAKQGPRSQFHKQQRSGAFISKSYEFITDFTPNKAKWKGPMMNVVFSIYFR